MSTWLNARIKRNRVLQHELFATEDAAIAALGKALDLHRAKGRIVSEKWEGPRVRYEVEDAHGFVSVHWLSDTRYGSD